MEFALDESKIPTNSQDFNLLTNENYLKNVNQSIQNLLHEYENGVSDTSPFASNFYELLQARVNPPLEAMWVYSALSFHSSNQTNGDVSNRVSIVKDLFQLVSACSASCSASKFVALLAPVVLEVYHLVVELWAEELSGKREKKAMREIECLVESVLGYINVCCEASNEENGDLVGTIALFTDLVCVWMKGNGGGGSESVESFLPLVSEEIRRKLSEGECDVSYLAGVVIMEAFLLRLCMRFHGGMSKQELEKELRNWAIGSISGFKSYDFYVTLVRMLLEPTFPVTALLNPEEEKLLRKVLYDAVILVDYSFLHIGREIQPLAERLNSLALTRLIVTHEATEFFRENGDPKRAISYLNAFSGSSLPSQLIRWVTSQIGTEGKASRPSGSSPKALIKWLLNLENQGIRMLNDSISKCHAKLVDVLEAEYEQPACEAEDKKSDNDLFYVDNKGEEEIPDDEDKEENESMSATFVAAAKAMKSVDNDGGRKRKDRSSKKKKQIKFLKYNLEEYSESAREKSSVTNNDSSHSGSEVENPLSGDDMEEREQ